MKFTTEKAQDWVLVAMIVVASTVAGGFSYFLTRGVF